MKILIADDELRLRKVVVLHLKKNGFEVVEASNGQKALDLLNTFEPDIIILDIMMPEKDGIEACKEIRSIEKYKNTPIILLTAKSGADDVEEGLEAGANEYITKPFSPKTLIEKINNLINEEIK
jgi:DNA-binding response OmpR family regulator